MVHTSRYRKQISQRERAEMEKNFDPALWAHRGEMGAAITNGLARDRLAFTPEGHYREQRRRYGV